MVKSVLDPTITYSESPKIDPADLDYDANLYETTIYEKDIIFALGKPKYTYVDKNIVYYSIYLVVEEEITMQIGVYEILASEEEKIYDEDGDIDLNKFTEPLLFAFTYSKLAMPSVATAPLADPSIALAEPKKATIKKKWIKSFMKSDNYDIIDTPYDGNCFFPWCKWL